MVDDKIREMYIISKLKVISGYMISKNLIEVKCILLWLRVFPIHWQVLVCRSSTTSTLSVGPSSRRLRYENYYQDDWKVPTTLVVSYDDYVFGKVKSFINPYYNFLHIQTLLR